MEKNYNLRIVRLQFSRPGDGAQAWKAMKIAIQAAIGLGAFWLLSSFILS